MTKFLRKSLLYLVMAVLVLPASAVTGIMKAPHAQAANFDKTIDNSSSAGFSTVGNWTSNSIATGYLNNYMEAGEGLITKAKWTPDITFDGEYDVFIHWSAGTTRPSNVELDIKYDGGHDTQIIDQTKDASGSVATEDKKSGWKLVGRYQFDASGINYVEIEDAAEGTTADAVKFVHDNIAPEPAVLEQPAQAAIVSEDSIDFDWSDAVDAENDPIKYELQISDGTEIVESILNISDSNKTFSNDLLAGDYFWRVRSFDGDKYSTWTAPFKFTVGVVELQIKVNSLTTNQASPVITGTVNDVAAQVQVIVNGITTSATVNADGTWSAVLSQPLVDGNYPVTANASKGMDTDQDMGNLIIDRTAPVVTGVEDGKNYSEEVTPASADIDIASVKLNGSDHDLGNKISEEGSYALIVTDLVGNATTINFSIYKAALVAPTVTATKIETTSGRFVRVAWLGVGKGVTKYEIYVNGVTSSDNLISVNSDDSAVSYSRDVKVINDGNYNVYVKAWRGTESTESIVCKVEFVTAQVVSAVQAAPSVPATSVAAPKAKAAETTPKVEPVKGDEEGKIKGEENDDSDSEKTNWTPWIVLSVLIILAGAATGGYFYWFSGVEEVKAVVREEKKTKSPKVVATKNNKPSSKKTKRW